MKIRIYEEEELEASSLSSVFSSLVVEPLRNLLPLHHPLAGGSCTAPLPHLVLASSETLVWEVDSVEQGVLRPAGRTFLHFLYQPE